MCFWIKFQENENTFREVSVHADTEDEAENVFQHDFQNVISFELITH